MIQAVCDFVHQHIRFDYQQACADRTALGSDGKLLSHEIMNFE